MTNTTNIARGDLTVQIQDRAYTLRPTFQSLCEIEAATGKAILDLAEQMAGGKIGLSDLGHIVTFGIKAGSNIVLHKEEIGEAIVKIGLAAVLSIVSEFVNIALTGETAPKRVKKKIA
jgi:hypothetical protein